MGLSSRVTIPKTAFLLVLGKSGFFDQFLTIKGFTMTWDNSECNNETIVPPFMLVL